MQVFQGKNVFLTGAASGIGRQLAIKLAERGCNLFLVDIDEARLKALANELTSYAVSVWPFVCDLSNLNDVDHMLHSALETVPDFDMLINNAGVAYYGMTTNMTQQQWDWLMTINLLAPIRITNRLMPILLSRPDTHLVNMCSISGLVAGGRFTAYHTSKFGLIGFTEAMRAENGRHGIGVTAICPGPVLTDLYRSTASDSKKKAVPTPPRWLSTTPERVADVTIKAILRNRRQVLITPMAHALFQMKRFAPGLIDFANRFSRNKRKRQQALRDAMTRSQSQNPQTAPETAVGEITAAPEITRAIEQTVTESGAKAA